MAFKEYVKFEAADNFSKLWNYKGLSIPLEAAHKQFAIDFANCVFSSFIEQQTKAVAVKLQAAEQKAKSLITEV